MPTVLTYNGVSIWGCVIRNFDDENVADDSGTDVLFRRYRVTVSGYIHGYEFNSGAFGAFFYGADAPSHLPKTAAASGAAQNHVLIRELLMAYRKPFKLRLAATVGSSSEVPTGGQVLLEANPVEASQFKVTDDLNNGPKPISFNIQHVSDNNVLRVEYTIELCRLGCDQSVYSEVLNNRWSMADDYDSNFFCTRTINGILRIRSAKINAHNLRGLVVPALEPGFARENMSFVNSEDGLTLRYAIIDKSVVQASPAPATDFQITHRMMVDYASTSTSECNVSLTGPTGADVGKMLEIAGSIIDAKLLIGRIGIVAGILQVTDFEQTTQTSKSENTVNMRCVVLHVGENLFANIKNIGRVMVRPVDGGIIPGYDPKVSLAPTVNGNVPIVKAFVARLQDMCEGTFAQFSDGIPATQSYVINKPSTVIQTATVPSADYMTNPVLSYETLTGLYSNYVVNTVLDAIGMTLHLPVAKFRRGGANSNSSSGNGTSSSGQTSGYDDWVKAPIGPPGSRVTYRFDATRIGKWPKLPRPVDFEADGIKYFLLDYTVVPSQPEVSADTSRRYTIRAEYRYGTNLPITGRIRIPPAPWITNPDLMTDYDTLGGPTPGGF